MLWCSDLSGFGVRAGKNSKTFIVLVASGRRFKLGRYPILSLASAREKARNKLAEIQLGANHKAVPYKELKARFLAEKLGSVRQRTYDSYEWLLGRVELKGDANAITTRTITDATKDLAPSVRQHLLAVFKLMFRYGVNEGLIKASPVESVTVRKAKSRKRVLTDIELTNIWHAVPANAFGTIVRLLILTGQRRNEVAQFQLQNDLVTIDGEHTKNHRTHVFPVHGVTIDLINQDRSWGGWSKSKADLDEASGVTDWTLHDLRRTFRTNWARLRLPREVAEKYINHVSGDAIQSPVEQVYDQHDYLDEMRESIRTYTVHLMNLLAPPTSSEL